MPSWFQVRGHSRQVLVLASTGICSRTSAVLVQVPVLVLVQVLVRELRLIHPPTLHAWLGIVPSGFQVRRNSRQVLVLANVLFVIILVVVPYE